MTVRTNWNQWLKQYEDFPSLQARLRIVQAQITAALDDCPPGPIQIVSICAGDGRDVLGVLPNHPRRDDVSALLIDNELESINCGRTAAERSGLAKQMVFICADAALSENYAGNAPADLVLLSGFLGHLRHGDVLGLLRSLPMFCKPGGSVIWNRHLVLYDGRAQTSAIREWLAEIGFEEKQFEITAPDGFAIGRVKFKGPSLPFDRSRVIFEFVGVDQLVAESPGGDPAIGWKGSPPGPETDEITTSIPERFAQIVAEHPRRLAVFGGDWQPDYNELNAAANRLAHALVSGGGAVGDRVALLLRHDAPLIATLLAVVKTGRVMVVLNSTDPPERLRQILEDAGPVAIVADLVNQKLAGEIAAPSQRVIYFEEQAGGPVAETEIRVTPDALAALIYTSGSTGKPKGVMLTHGNILHNVLQHSHGLQLSAEDRILLLGSPAGGQGMATVWCALLNGAVLCPFPAAERGVTGLAGWIRDSEISVYISSVSVFRHLIRTLDDDERFPRVRIVRFASEPAAADDFKAYQKFFREDCVLLNTLSSSETGNVTRQRYTKHDPVPAGRLPIGREVGGVKVVLLDEAGHEVGMGETGEMIVCGRHISPGYWRNEAMTVEKFSTNGGAGVRHYRSGDLARRLSDGTLVFMDRRDARVKVQGYRVEISEIEETLLRQPEVREVVINSQAMPDGNVRLAAYVVLQPGRKCTAEELRHNLRKTLPGYMVPAGLVFLDRVPLSPNGKVDRQALPAPAESRTLQRAERPRDVVETSLARIWESVMGIAPGRNDDFFDLGGNSLQSSQVLARIEESFGASLPPSMLVEHGTIAKLAELVSGHVIIRSPSPLVQLCQAGQGRPLFLIHSGQGDVATYGLLARRVGSRPVYGLQAVGLQGESWPLGSITSMADRYLEEILKLRVDGPYLLAGTCMGGLVAFEMAQRLVRSGKQVGLLALMDVPYPEKTWQQSEFKERIYATLADQVRDAFRILRWAALRGTGLGRRDRWLTSYRRFVAHMCARANRGYTPELYPGKLNMFLTRESKFKREDLRLKLRGFARETSVEYLPGRRAGLFMRPVVDQLAEKIRHAIEAGEKAEQEGPA